MPTMSLQRLNRLSKDCWANVFQGADVYCFLEADVDAESLDETVLQ